MFKSVALELNRYKLNGTLTCCGYPSITTEPKLVLVDENARYEGQVYLVGGR